MEHLRHAKVSTYAGYKGDERPISFIAEDQKIEVMEILDRWYDLNYNAYKIKGSDDLLYLMKHDLNEDSWSVEIIEEKSSQ